VAGQVLAEGESTTLDEEAAQETAGEEGQALEEETTQQETMYGGTVRVGVTYDTPNMNHLVYDTMSAAQVLIFDTLVVRGPDGSYYPLLAESWRESADHLQWTFNLRQGVTFHDETPFNAEAAKWFFDLARDPNGDYPFSESYSAVEEILAPDESTLIFALNKPWPKILLTLSDSFAGLISPTAYELYGEDYGDEHAVGTGPFMLGVWSYQDETIVVRNPYYNWGPEFLTNQGPPRVSSIDFIYLPESTTRISELEDDEIDYAYDIPPRELSGLVDSGNYSVFKIPAWGGGLFYIDLNHSKPPLNDVRVRQALNYAIDIETLASYVYGVYGTPAYGYTADHWKCGLEDPQSVGYGYDLEKARELLAEAGWVDSDENGVLDKDGKSLSLTMVTYNDDESKQYGELVRDQLFLVGINVKLELMEYTDVVELYEENKNEMSLVSFGWLDSDVYSLFFHSDQIPYLNSSHVNDSRMDRLLNLAQAATTNQERCDYYAQVEAYAIEQAEWAPIFWETYLMVANNRLQGLLVTPYSVFLNDVSILIEE
jgi:peptide/nickel transport system substrate-binding protein